MFTVCTSDYSAIRKKIDQIDPVSYAETRNYVDGAVTYLSPYISRGVISTKQVLESVLKKGYALPEITSFAKELCWRDYFQRVAQHKDLNSCIKQAQFPISNYDIPRAIVEANTGVSGIDQAIETLYQSGYMHNHCRMYTASVACNLAQSHWLLPAKWMYFHLLDGDWASNACSWQWVAGANSTKKYVANQENINRFTRTNQTGTFLDYSYEELAELEIPSPLSTTQKLELRTVLPSNTVLQVDESLPTFIYNYYNLDPVWRSDEKGNRIILLEPAFFATYPISEKCVLFMLNLAKNIPGIQVFTGSFEELVTRYQLKNVYYKEHPFNAHYIGKEDPRDWISDVVMEYYPSFFSYWKTVEQLLVSKYA